MGKSENAGNQHFLFFPQCFLSHQGGKSSYELHLSCLLQFGHIQNYVMFGNEPLEKIVGKQDKRAKMALDRSPDFLRLL